MHNPALALALCFFLLQGQAPVPSSQGTPQEPQPASPVGQDAATQPAKTSDSPKATGAGKFILQDGTPVKLRITRNVSSADAIVGETVDFEVLEEININEVTVIPKGGTAIGTVTEAVPKRRMGRAGKLEIVLDYVRLADKEKTPVRAVKDAKGGSHTAGMTIGIVATGLLFWPAAPLFLLMHGKDITIPKGAEITAYVNGDQKLVASNFLSQGDTFVFLSAPASGSSQAVAVTNPVGSFEVRSLPESAEIYVDGAFSGNSPAILKLKPGQHVIRVTLPGYKDWSRDLTVQEGSDAHLTANLEKLEPTPQP